MTRLAIILALVSTLLGAGFLTQCDQISQLKNEKENAVQAATNLNSTVERITNKYNQEVVVRKQAELDKHSFEQLMNGKVDSLAELAGVKDKQLAEYTNVNARLRMENIRLRLQPADTVIVISENGDTTTQIEKHFTEQQKYFSITGKLIDCIMIELDSIMMDAPLDIFLTYQRKKGRLFGKRRKWLPRWGPKEYEKRITSPNPDLRIDDIQSFKIEKR